MNASNDSGFGLDVVLIYSAMMLMCCSLLIWSIFIRPYMRRHGLNPAFALFNWSPHIDYFRARKFAKQSGHIPWFIRLFEIMFGAALALVIAFCVHIILNFG